MNKNSWISVKDELPEYGREVLVYTKCERQHIGYRSGTSASGEHWTHQGKKHVDPIFGVSHWMHLPPNPV